ncbi:MAG: hypothetical protein AAF915_28160 [Cyanobacteria bacterium P01_D01_bin.50]
MATTLVPTSIFQLLSSLLLYIKNAQQLSDRITQQTLDNHA